MHEIYCNGKTRVATLTTSEIIELHKVLCDNYDLLPEMEPISPSGIKSMDMLESAVSRQVVGSGDYYKYPDIFSNCATLVYGLVKNHAFHNGNKRIGFLALIKHLYLNSYVISPFVKHMEIYELLRNLANSSLDEHAAIYFKHYFKQYKRSEWTIEIQINYLSNWLRSNSEHKTTKIKQKTIPLNDLEQMLRTKDLETSFSGRYLTVIKKVSLFKEILGKKPLKKDYIIKSIKGVPLNLIEQMRRDFGIAFLDGVDNSTFYNENDFINNEIVSYKKIIYKLAKT